MERILFLIDGFNLYHSIKYNKNHHKYRWLNLEKMCQCFITKNKKIINIFYFTAYATWRPSSMARHKIYVKALELFNIIPIFGKFKIKDRFCPNCKKEYLSHEEKQTDVNIAIKLLQEAINDSYDNAIIVSVDSDLIPAIKAVKNLYPTKK